MKKPPVAVVLIVLSLISFPASSPSCPVVLTLWDLVAQADLIVLARVASVELAEPPIESYDTVDLYARDIATLHVLETWKGSSAGDVRVQFRSSPDSQYREGETLLVFLERGETRAAAAEGAWIFDIDEATWVEEGLDPAEFRGIVEEQERMREATGVFARWAAGRYFDAGSLSDEITHPAPSQRAALKALVERAALLQVEGPVDEADRRDWLVAAAELRITREEAIDALAWMSRGPEFFGAVDPETDDAAGSPRPLTEAEMTRIAAGFAREPAFGFVDVMTLKLLASSPDLDVDRAAASVVEAGLLLDPIPGWVTALVDVTLRRFGDDFAARIGRDDVDKRGRPVVSGPRNDTLPTIWAVARRELGIPEALPAEIPVRRVRGYEEDGNFD